VAPTPDIIGFVAPGANGSIVTIGPWVNNFATENASQSWSITNPDSQTLVFQVRQGDEWPTDVPAAKDRSEVRLGVNPAYNIFPVGQEVNISYNFEVLNLLPLRTDTNWFTIGQFHNDDVTMGGHTSPPIELDLQPTEFMSIYVGYLTASGPPTGTVSFVFETINNGFDISYSQIYLDPNPVVCQYNYKVQIQCKATGPGDTSGFLNVWRDGVQIVKCSGQIGFGFNTNWDFGIYRHADADTQIAQYQNMMISTRPLLLGTASTYVPVAGDVGNAVTCTVTESNTSGSGVPPVSAATSAVIP
jgi:hypothetical protein